MRNTYYAQSKVRDDNIIFCTFDTETEGLGGKLLCTSWSTPFGTDISIGENSTRVWLDKIFFSLPWPCIHFAHFAQYDWRYIIAILLRMKNEGKITDLKFNLRSAKDIYQIEVRIEKKKYLMRDSYALYPDTLKRFSKDFSPDLAKLSLDFESETFNVMNPAHIEYAKRDAKTLRECLSNYATSVKKLFDISIGHTAAGTAVKAWQKTLPESLVISYSQDSEIERFIREGYYGGVVFLTSIKQYKNAKTIDINSSYPYIMETFPMPIGSPIECSEYLPGRLAIYRVIIKTPDDLIVPIIPSRNVRGLMEWRRGTFETTITNFEIEFAVSKGHKIQKIIKGYAWEETINPFYEFIQKCKSIRKQYKGTSYEGVAKRNQNSLYGKFGARRTTNRVIFGQENIEGVDNVQLFSDEWDDIYIVNEYAEDMPCKPEWAVFITALARIRLLAAAYAIGIEHVLYGDTDSLTIKESGNIEDADIGLEYGQFKLEKEWRCFRAIAPKTYAGQLENGKWTGAGKGLSAKKMTQTKYRELYESGHTDVEYQSLPSLVVALKQGIAPAHQQKRASSDIQNSVNFTLQGEDIVLKFKHESKNNLISEKTKKAS